MRNQKKMKAKRFCFALKVLVLGCLLFCALYFRSSGLFRGLDQGGSFHPDAGKQVMMLENYLHGNYVQYYDSRFYDGYPYGLNRFDEGVIRAIQTIRRPLLDLLYPWNTFESKLSRLDLYYWGRGLRVLYGLGVVGLIFLAVFRCTRRFAPAAIGAGFYALSPLGSTVTHSVTGDVGVDLFLAASLCCAVEYMRKGTFRWLAAFSVACGMAFACKFQGILGLWIGAWLGIAGIRRCDGGMRKLFSRATALPLGFLGGILALNPALALDPSKTWRNMRINFSFIRNYGVPAEFLAQPLLERMGIGVTENAPMVFRAMGHGFSVLAALALVTALWRLLQTGRRGMPDSNARTALERRRLWGEAAMASFVWMALFLSIALKPAVQPFHFSFLLPAMAVSVGLFLERVRRQRIRILRFTSVLFVSVALAELWVFSVREDFFWKRPETMHRGALYSKTVFGHAGFGVRNLFGEQMIKQFFAEPARLPVFRNRPTGLEHPEAAWWRAHRRLPVPSVPYPKEAHWIFVNGPVFPRNDRMFLVPAAGPVRFSRKGYERQPLVKVALRGKDAWVDRTLVFQTAPETLTLGLRTGRWPARFSLKIEGAGDIEDWMPPHSQRVLEVRNFSFARTFPAGKKTPAAFLLPMSTRSRLGPLWVTVLENSTDRALFERFGPEMSDGGGELGNTIDSGELARRMEGLTYLGDDVPFEVSRDPEPLPGSGFPLAAGPYVFTARLENRGDVAAGIRFALDDIFKGRRRVAEHTVPLAPGALETVTWRFEKKFAPYDGVLSVVSEAPGVFVDFWDLRPDAAALEQWRPTEPAALGPATADRKEVSLEVRYPGLGVLRRLRLPREWHSDGEVRYAARFDLDRNIRHKTFLEAVIFLHVLNEENKIVAALDYPLREASFSSSRPNPQFASSPPPGTYRLTGGIYNIRTRKRYRFDPPERLKFDPKRRYLELIPEIEVLPLRPERP